MLSADGTTRIKPRIALLAGADLIQTMSQPEVWSPADLEHILGRFGAFIVERAGTDIHQALASLQRWRRNIHVIQQVFQNNMSSTQIRLHIKRDMSVRYRECPGVSPLGRYSGKGDRWLTVGYSHSGPCHRLHREDGALPGEAPLQRGYSRAAGQELVWTRCLHSAF